MFSAFIKNTNVGSGMKSGGITLLLLILFTVFLSHGPHEKLQPVALAAAITSCDGCHGNPPVDNVSRTGETTGQFPGSHNKHTGAGATQYAMVCTKCHYNNTAYKHSNGFINISGTDVKGNSYTAPGGKNKPVSNTPSFGSCTNVYCHSKKVNDARVDVAVPVLWSTSMPADCTGCHGNDKGSLVPMTADAHKAHVNNTNGRFAGLSIKCIECHASTVAGDNRTLQPSAYGAAGVHANGTPTVEWGTGVNAGYPAYVPGASCAWPATYCHSSLAGGAAPNNTIPGSWSSVADDAQTNSSCAYCHGGTVSDGTPQSSNKHSLHLNVIAGNIPNNEFSCSRCHAYTMRPDNSLFTNSTSQHLNRAANVRFKTPFSNRTGAYVVATKTCSNTYCHGGGASGTWNTTTQTRTCESCHAGRRNPTILWSPPHNRHYSSALIADLSTAANGWRGQNRSIPSTTLFSCGVCHNVKTSHVSGPPAANLGDAELMFNFYTAWGPSAYSRPSVATKSTAGVVANLRAFRYSPETSCSVYCHSNGKNNFIPRYVQWKTGTVGCGTGACHQIGGVQYDWSSAHNKHVGTYIRGGNTWIKCNSCHTGTVNTVGVIRNRQRHVNGYANVSSALINVGGNTTFIYVPGTQTCTSNNYCHSNGRGTLTARRYTNIVWSVPVIPATCTSCHGGKPGAVAVTSDSGFALSSSHSKHLNASASINCSICHSKTVTLNSSLVLKPYSGVTYHVNQSRNVILNNTYGSYTSYKGTFKCGNTSCHGGITRNAWSTPNTGHTCSKCHGVNGTSIAVPNAGDSRKFFAPGWNTTGTDTDGNSAGIIVGAHFVHLSSVYTKKIKCNECHLVPAVVTDAGHNEAKRLNSTTISFLQASSATVIGGAPKTYLSAATFNGYTAGNLTNKAATCSSVYCHGTRLKNNDTGGSAKKPSWNQDLTSNTPSALVCGRCHGAPPTIGGVSSVHIGYVFPGDCNGCHPHVSVTGAITDKNLHINGLTESVATCLGCHSKGKKKTLGRTENNAMLNYTSIRKVNGAGGDFVRLSRHVSNGLATPEIVTNWDCVVCHMEGNTADGNRSANHNDGTVSAGGYINLRNVDSPANGWVINNKKMTEAMRTDMDTFCLNCHDTDGAKGIAVNATNSGLNYDTTGGTVARNTLVWNTLDNKRNGRDGLTGRTRVIDVKTQFFAGSGGSGTGYNGNPSQHAVLGARYSANNATWTSTGWTAHTLRNGTNVQTIREMARLHCSDCHLNETNAHGATNAWYMLLNGTANNYTTDAVGAGGTGAPSATITVCYKCHSSTTYGASGSTPSRVNHSIDSGNTFGGGADAPSLGTTCLLCHAGDDFGGIHGVSGTYNPGATFPPSGTGVTRYRFLPGAWMQWQPGGGDAGFNTAGTGTCYFPASSTMSGCSSHAGSTKTNMISNYARPVKY